MLPAIPKFTSKNLRALLLCFCLLFFTACMHLPVKGSHSAGLTIHALPQLGSIGVFAVDPAGGRLALAADGLLVVDLSSGVAQKLTADTPSAVGWSPSGRFLGAAFSMGKENTLKLLGRDGALKSETRLSGRIAGIFVISDNEVLVAVTKLQAFSFGAACQEILYHWKTGGEPIPQILHETTLKPLTLKKWSAAKLSLAMQPALSPLGDELLYAKLQDPPAFAPYLKIVIRNLHQNVEREIASIGLDPGKSVFAGDGEEVIVGNVAGQTRQLSAWDGEERRAFPLPGHKLAISPSGLHLLIDGHLYRDQTEIAAFPSQSEAVFLADGRLLIGWEGRLYLVEGIESIPVAPDMDAEHDDRLKTIKAWRSGGLITPAEYAATKEKVLHQ